MGQAKRYIDREKGVSLTIPANWTSQKFSIGALALRIEGYDNGHYANCSLTIVPTNPSSNSQDWLDKNINSVPPTDSQQKYLIDMLEAGSGGKINNHYATIQKLGGRNARTLFYTSTSYSSKNAANIYMESFYSSYVRSKDQVGMTCVGGGLSRLDAHASFEWFNSTFQGILDSVRFDGQ